MKLFTREIIKKATEQFKMRDSLKQIIVAKFFNPCGAGTWWLLNMNPEDENYCWGFAEIFCFEMGSFLRTELEEIKVPPFYLPIERDPHFKPITAQELWDSKTN